MSSHSHERQTARNSLGGTYRLEMNRLYVYPSNEAGVSVKNKLNYSNMYEQIRTYLKFVGLHGASFPIGTHMLRMNRLSDYPSKVHDVSVKNKLN